jgi:hypothetical protein
MLGSMIAAKTGPDHFSSTYDTLKGGFHVVPVGGVATDDEGNVIAHSPLVQDAQGGLWDFNSVMSGAAATGKGGDTSAAGGFNNAVATVLNNEGGYNPKDMNGAPVNFGINAKANADELKKLGVSDIKNLTRDQAVQIYRDKYWAQSGAENLPANLQTPYFDVYVRNPKIAKKALADSGGDPARFVQLTSAYFQNLAKKPSGQPYASAWAARDANNMAIATGGAGPTASSGPRLLLPGKDKPAPSGFQWNPDGKTLSPIPGGPADDNGQHFRILTPAEAQAQGLDGQIKYQVNTQTGQITALGGQNRQAKQIPQQVETKVQPLVDVRDSLNRLSSTFKSDFGGHTITGGLLNDIQGVANVGPDGMRDWWADWNSMDNVVRNQLFGSALTEHEKKAYEATTISPRMDPAQIEKNMNRRLAIVTAAAERQRNFLKKNGYDPDAVDALFAPLGNFGSGVGPKARTVVRTGVQKSTGKRVVQYSDGSIEVQK